MFEPIKPLSRRSFLATTSLGVSGFIWGCSGHLDSPLVLIYHAPKMFARRSGDFTVNICGAIASSVKHVEYRLNRGPWIALRQRIPRVPPPLFTLEFSHRELQIGLNELDIKAFARVDVPEITSLSFEYDPKPISLPIEQNWSDPDLDVQDGYWEQVWLDGHWRVRPKPGFEDYDRIVVVSGAFKEGRRIKTDVIFRGNVKEPFGFGVLPLWGGRPDDPDVHPGRGWNFSLVWYYSHYQGIGMEFSYKYADHPPLWISSYRSIELKPNLRYTLTIECYPERDSNGTHLRYRQRMQWDSEGQPHPYDWIEMSDTEGAMLPEGEYAVALVAHRCSVDFGPVFIEPFSLPK